MKNSLWQFIIVAILLIFASAHTKLMAQPESTSAEGAENSGRSSDRRQEISIATLQSQYRSGGEVAFTIVNTSAGTIYYTFGCSVPVVHKINGSDHTVLMVDVYESIPDLNVLGAGEEQTCRWNQQAWQDTSQEGNARFQHYYELALVPAGQYQFRLDYYIDEADIDYSEKAQTVHSKVFMIY